MQNRISLIFIGLLFLGAMLAKGQASVQWFDVNPDQSDFDATDPDGASGGRVNHLGVAQDLSVVYAATEWGGLWRSFDQGLNWSKVYSFTPTAVWDVKVDPSNSRRLYVTSFHDGRQNGSRSGISISTDAGATWTNAALPPVGSCALAARRTQLYGWQICIDPDNSRRIYVGTSCGLAISNDRGVNWVYVDPSGGTAEQVYSVVAHNDTIVDVITDNGHWRSLDQGTTWTTVGVGGAGLPGGIGDLAVSPDESYVLFATVGGQIFESDNGGNSWPSTLVNPFPQGRIPFVRTNQRSTSNQFDLWFGDVGVARTSITTPNPPAINGARRSQANNWSADFSRNNGGHNDVGDLSFDPSSQTDACPLFFANDGGVYFNTIENGSGDCHTPIWEQPDATPHATWLFGFDGRQNPDGSHAIYTGLQDNGTWGTTNAPGGTDPNLPDWTNNRCCDGFDAAADPNGVVFSRGFFGPPRGFQIFRGGPGYTGVAQINNYPNNNAILTFTSGRTIVQFSGTGYALNLADDVHVTQDITATPINWTALGTANGVDGGLKVSSIGNTVNFLHFTGGNGRPYDTGRIQRYAGVAAGGTWDSLPLPPNMISFTGVYDVDQSNPNRLMVTALGTGNQATMWSTTDYGATWVSMAALDNLMTAGGAFRNPATQGPRNFIGSVGNVWQPYMVEINPNNPQVAIAGAADAGIFLTTNFGGNWQLISNFSAPTTASPHIPRPLFAHFSPTRTVGSSNAFDVWIGSQGFGVTKVVATYGVGGG